MGHIKREYLDNISKLIKPPVDNMILSKKWRFYF